MYYVKLYVKVGGYYLYLLQQMFDMKRKHFLQMMTIFPVAYGLSSIGKWYDDAMDGPNTDLMLKCCFGSRLTHEWHRRQLIFPKVERIGNAIVPNQDGSGGISALANPGHLRYRHGTSKDNIRFWWLSDALYQVKYPAPGSPALAKEVADALTSVKTGMDHEWGLDHGTWTIVRHMYPNADIPVLQLSIDYSKDAAWHFNWPKTFKTSK